ncbi:MAG: ABC transporter permease [Candidatus Bathyarchaeia archaeon]
MPEQRPLGLRLLILLSAAIALTELIFGVLLFTVGNPLETFIPSINGLYTGLVLVAFGLLGLYVFYNLRGGEAIGWVSALAFSGIDVAAKLGLLTVYGGSWTPFALSVVLDFAVLYYLTRPSVMPLFGGGTVRAVFQKFRTEIGPRIKELRFSLKLMRKSSLSIIGLSIIIFFVLMAILAPYLAHPGDVTQGGDPNMIPIDRNLLAIMGVGKPQPPSAAHPFGTMDSQYDIYYGVIWGARSALRIGVYVAGSSLIIGLLIGIIASYYGGWIDEVLMRFTDIIFAFPYLILCMTLVVVLVPIGFARLDAVMIAMVIVGWPGYARLIRGEVLRIKNEDYVEAAKSVGCSDARIIGRHILPNSIYPVLVVFSLDIGTIVLAAAALSFLGLGAPEGYADWGQIIAVSQNYIYGPPSNPFLYWYTFIIPGAFISLFVMGWNLLGDALRDILDPTLRRK